MPWHQPKTWRPGDIRLIASILNYELRDQLLYLWTTLIGADYETGWQTPTLNSPWVDLGGGSAPSGYLKQGNWVHLRGVVDGGSEGTSIMTLPSGYRPLYYSYHSVQALSGPAYVQIEPDGDVVFLTFGATPWVALDSVSFRVI